MSKVVENPVLPPQPTDQLTVIKTDFWWNKAIAYIKNNYFLIISIVTLLIVIFTIFFIFSRNSRQPNQSITLEMSGSRNTKSTTSQIKPTQLAATPPSSNLSSSPSPTPTILTPGPGVYNVSQGEHTGPTISKVTFDPLDVKKDQTLTITVHVLSSTPANQITATLQTDTSTENLTFTKSSTDNKYEVWTSEIILPESVLYKYILTITPQSNNGSTKVIVAPRS